MIPELFKIGSFHVRSFGVMILIAFLAGLWLLRRRAPRYGFDINKVTDLSFTALIFGVLGARLAYIIQEIPYYREHPRELVTLEFAGLTSFGGVILGAVAVAFWARKNQASLADLFDLFGPSFMLGHVFGRIGCFLNGCCYGGVCDASFPLATKFPGLPNLHHPAQLYDSAMNLAGLGLVLLYEKRGISKPGQVASVFLVLHGLTRFIYEFWRAGTPQQVEQGLASSTYWGSLPITEAQAVALLMTVVGIVAFLVCARKQRAEPAAEIQTA